MRADIRTEVSKGLESIILSAEKAFISLTTTDCDNQIESLFTLNVCVWSGAANANAQYIYGSNIDGDAGIRAELTLGDIATKKVSLV